jgi:hypothetical protein
VFTVAIASLMSLVLFAFAARYSSRIESAALRLTQQKLEELKAYSLEHPVLSGPGNPLNGEGRIDFSVPANPQATVISQVVLNVARNTSLSFETRWNVTSTGMRKIITVATRKIGSASAGVQPVNLKVVLAP